QNHKLLTVLITIKIKVQINLYNYNFTIIRQIFRSPSHTNYKVF
ncbi:hypothetical protein LINPERPRIM_LOCUS41199, partial [Linum perenne]